MEELLFKTFSDSASAPITSANRAAGFDSFFNKTKIISEYDCESIITDIEIEISKGSSGRMAPCSRLALKQ